MHEEYHSSVYLANTKVDHRCDLLDFMETTGSRLRRLRKAKGLTQAQLASKVGLGQSAIGNIEAGTRGYGASVATIADALGVSAGYLLLTDATDERFALPDGAIQVAAKPRRVWVVGKGAGGLAERVWDDGDYPVGATEDFGEITSPDPQAFLVRVEGASMWPKYEPGNFALVEPNTPPEVEDVVLVRLTTGETMIKRLLSQRNGYVFGSFNEQVRLEYPPEAISWMYYVAHEVPRKRIKSRNGGVL